MSSSTEHSADSLVFADHDQNYYLIPVEAFERGRVPAERKAEIEQAMREHEVTGYNPLVAVAVGTAIGAVAGATIAVGAAGVGFAAGYTLASSQASAPATNSSGPKIAPGT